VGKSSGNDSLDCRVGCSLAPVEGLLVPFFFCPLKRRYRDFIDCQEWEVIPWVSAKIQSLLPKGEYVCPCASAKSSKALSSAGVYLARLIFSEEMTRLGSG